MLPLLLQKPEFEWNSLEKGLILSSFSWGLMFSFLGGILSSKFGGSNIFGLGVAVTAMLTMLTPTLIRFNITIFIIARIAEGFAEVSNFLNKLKLFLNITHRVIQNKRNLQKSNTKNWGNTRRSIFTLKCYKYC